MRIFLSLMLIASALAVLCLTAHDLDRWPVHDEGTTTKSFTLSGSPMRVVVDNIDGYVHLTGTNTSQVRVTAHKVIHAETDADLQQARNEVKLDTDGQPGSVSVYYDAPWRCHGDNTPCRDQQRHFYDVSYDIDVEAPRQARVVISTVNHGDIRIDGTAGDFDVNNINGAITMVRISGAGSVRTINGPISVRFTNNPSGSSRFASINGQMDVYFQPHLSADLLFKTFNGQIYTDFEVTPAALPAIHGEERGGKFVYRSNGMVGGRAGGGGPELTFDAFNGNIRLHEMARGAATNE